MSSRCRNIRCSSSDYNQPNNNKNRSASLKSRAQQSINKINQKAFIARDSIINCCDDRIMEAMKNNKIGSSSNNIRWQNVLVFSVVVLINIASISCVAARQIEGESEK
jgi:hypothetical protein